MSADRAVARTRHPRHQRRGEARLPAAVATLVAIALYLALPEQLLVAPRFVVPALEFLLLVPLIAINPRRVTRQTRLSRVLSLSLVVVIGLTNLGALGCSSTTWSPARATAVRRCCWGRCRCG